VSAVSERLQATLAKMQGEARLAAAAGKVFSTTEIHSEYHITYPYHRPAEVMWNIGEGILIARELQMHLQVLFPVQVALTGDVLNVGYTCNELKLSITLLNKRNVRRQDVYSALASFGMEPSYSKDSHWLFSKRKIMIYFHDFPDFP
jgi:hypothetical protein